MKRKLICIFVLIGCIPLLLASFYFYSHIYSNVMKQNDLESENNLSASKSAILNTVEDRMIVLRTLALNPNIKGMNIPEAKSALINAQNTYSDISIILDNSTGLTVARGDGDNLEVSLADRTFFQKAMQGNEVISEALISKVTGQPIVMLAIPVRDGQKNSGVLQGSITLEKLTSFVKKSSGEDALVYIIDTEGKILAHPNDKIAKERTDMSQIDYVQRGLKGETGKAFRVDSQGREMIVHFTRDESTGWVICSEMPKDKVLSSLKRMTLFIVIGVLILIAVIFAFGYVFSARITKPISLMNRCVEEVAGGNLSCAKLNFTLKDEIGNLGKSFDSMTTNLQSLVQQVSSASGQIAASSEELNANSEQSAQAATQVAASATDTAQGVEKQVNFVDKVLMLIENISANAKGEAANAQDTLDIAKRAVAAASEGNKAVDTAINQMKNIQQTVDTSARVVAELGEYSNEIGQIVETISGIAGQTNLLALNAAIEAARAGEQGRGFAVVAEEVRKLAEQSEESAKKISKLISDIRGKTESAVLAMESGTQEVRRGSEVVDLAGKVFFDIEGHVKEVASIAEKAANGMEQLATSSHDVFDATREIERISRAISGQAQTISAATQEQSASMEEIASFSQHLAQLAENLQTAITRFKV